MNYQEYHLPLPYSQYIECVWMYSSNSKFDNSETQWWLPNGTFDLVFNLGSSYKRINVFNQSIQGLVEKSALIGQMKESVKIELGESKKVVGIRFKAYGLFAWLGIPIKELTGQTIQLSDLLGEKAAKWQQKIEEAISDEQIIQTIIEFLEIRHKIDLVVLDAVRQILKNKGIVKIKDLCKNYNISQKTLENRFAITVGIQPKELARIYRFNHFLISSLQKPAKTFTFQAYECDFFDQSHLIKDFKKITSKTPKSFFYDHSDLIEINKLSMQKRFFENY